MSQRSGRYGPARRQTRHGDENDNGYDEDLFAVHQLRNTRNKRSSRSSNARAANSRASMSQGVLSQPSTSRASQRVSAPQEENLDDSYNNSQSARRATQLDKEEENNLIGSVVRYLLLADRPKTFIQRQNIIKAAMPNHSKYYKNVMAKVKVTMREVFGYNLVELEGSKYILTNNLANSDPHLHFSNSERAEQVLLFIALSHIFMTDEFGCKEENLFDLFRALSIIEDTDFKNDYFGDVKHLLTEKFVKQGYLSLVTVDKSEPVVQHYQWGARAKHELSPRHVLEFMSKIYGGRSLNTWPVQYKRMETTENLDTSQ